MLTLTLLTLLLLTGLLLNITVAKKSILGGSNIIISAYALSATTGLLLLVSHEKYIPFANSENLPLVFLFLSCITISAYPILSMKSESFERMRIPSLKKIESLSLVTLILSFYSIIFFATTLADVFRYEDKENFRYLLADGHHPFIEPSIFNSAAGTIATFYIVPLCLGFTNLIHGKIKTGSLLITSSLSYPIFLFAYLGRDGVLFWLISFIITFAGIKNNLSKSTLSKLKFIFSIIASISIMAFILITASRFGSENIWKSILDYLGQPIINLSKIYGENIPHSNGAISNLPIYSTFTNSTFEGNHLNQALDSLDSPIWVFGTYLKQLYIDYGSLGTITTISAFSIVAIFYTKKRKDLGSFIFYTFYVTFAAQSVFYFRHYNNVGHFYLVSMPFICAFISLISSKKSQLPDVRSTTPPAKKIEKHL